MFSNFISLDYIWKSVFLVAAISTIILFFGLILETIFVKYTTGKERKWFYNFQTTTLLGAIVFSFGVVKVDPEIVSACFTKFAQSSDSFAITRLISFSYIFVLAVLVSWDFIGTSLSLKSLSKLKPLENKKIKNKIHLASTKLNITKPINTYLCEEAISPFVFGLFKHRLYLPKHLLNSGDDEKIEALILHELAHIKGNDSIWLALTHICKRILFFIPLVYNSSNRHHLAIELAADEQAVLRGQVRPKKFIDSLIEMATLKFTQTSVFQVNATKGFKNLKERITSVGTIKEKKKLDWKFSLSAGLAMFLSLWFAMAQAAITRHSTVNSSGGLMCSQIQHEKIIEDWLKIQPSPNRCEK